MAGKAGHEQFHPHHWLVPAAPEVDLSASSGWLVAEEGPLSTIGCPAEDVEATRQVDRKGT